MAYKWDNKKPTAQMLGRWQPFHDGHYTLFKEIIKKTGQVCIQIRDVQGVDDNPFDFETVKRNIEEKLNPEFEDKIDNDTIATVNAVNADLVGFRVQVGAYMEQIPTDVLDTYLEIGNVVPKRDPNSGLTKYLSLVETRTLLQSIPPNLWWN